LYSLIISVKQTKQGVYHPDRVERVVVWTGGVKKDVGRGGTATEPTQTPVTAPRQRHPRHPNGGIDRTADF
jgi:hypothetical protein